MPEGDDSCGGPYQHHHPPVGVITDSQAGLGADRQGKNQRAGKRCDRGLAGYLQQSEKQDGNQQGGTRRQTRKRPHRQLQPLCRPEISGREKIHSRGSPCTRTGLEASRVDPGPEAARHAPANNPFPTSSAIARPPQHGPTTRMALVAPGFPLPTVRRSIPFRILTSSHEKGMLPAMKAARSRIRLMGRISRISFSA
ncbi:MAG: hypothetical protein UZ16_OP3001000057 [Candidatus Hinthialibacteria bacterium OLB16]|nr:MAG: hypothetical protein UZ16_OP3001000057 [Candidatus Hinthialibacteria bacterium OLB16]